MKHTDRQHVNRVQRVCACVVGRTHTDVSAASVLGDQVDVTVLHAQHTTAVHAVSCECDVDVQRAIASGHRDQSGHAVGQCARHVTQLTHVTQLCVGHRGCGGDCSHVHWSGHVGVDWSSHRQVQSAVTGPGGSSTCSSAAQHVFCGRASGTHHQQCVDWHSWCSCTGCVLHAVSERILVCAVAVSCDGQLTTTGQRIHVTNMFVDAGMCERV